jgi:hypothetical protein
MQELLEFIVDSAAVLSIVLGMIGVSLYYFIKMCRGMQDD